jgi:hypothetical protein
MARHRTPLEGYTLRYIYFLNRCALEARRRRTAVQPSARGATMHRGGEAGDGWAPQHSATEQHRTPRSSETRRKQQDDTWSAPLPHISRCCGATPAAALNKNEPRPSRSLMCQNRRRSDRLCGR